VVVDFSWRSPGKRGHRHRRDRRPGGVFTRVEDLARPHSHYDIQERSAAMAEPVPVGSDVTAGTYTCTRCTNRLTVSSTKRLPPCAVCGHDEWVTATGGNAVNGPSPAVSR
jgi:hypothetical protein